MKKPKFTLSSADSGHEIPQQSLESCKNAHSRFQKGSQQVRKQIMLELGVSFKLTDNKLIVKTEKWIQLIADRQSKLKVEFHRVRTNDSQISKADLYAKIPTWHSGRDSNPRPAG